MGTQEPGAFHQLEESHLLLQHSDLLLQLCDLHSTFIQLLLKILQPRITGRLRSALGPCPTLLVAQQDLELANALARCSQLHVQACDLGLPPGVGRRLLQVGIQPLSAALQRTVSARAPLLCSNL